jgi:hypothetical protein
MILRVMVGVVFSGLSQRPPKHKEKKKKKKKT